MSDALPDSESRAALPRDGGPEFNRLVFEASPYLLQHARNPVNWYPWGPEARARAEAEQKPIFLSIGYSTCHWCHVMEHESFEHEGVAAMLNAQFVCVKVDREERPDLDEIYMAATQAITGRGGWPMSVWLLPDGRPFYAGTYFPREGRGGQPGFMSVCNQLSAYFRDEPEAVHAQAADLLEAVQAQTNRATEGHESPTQATVLKAMDALKLLMDPVDGGFPGAPKFPPHAALRLLLHRAEAHGDAEALALATATLRAMAGGGVHDQVGGGFHRYATDTHWFLPHFEKMLYDNAQLLGAYTDAWRLTGNGEFRRVAERLADWVLREMRDESGGFWSAWDADSEGEEGTFYVWSDAALEAALEPDALALVRESCGVQTGGNWIEEATRATMPTQILHRPVALEALAAARGASSNAVQGQLDAAFETLRVVRAERIHPHLDDKVLAAWNGLMIGALARAGAAFERPDYIAAAAGAAQLISERLTTGNGRLFATWKRGTGDARLAGYLDDYAFMANGLLDLHSATGTARWRDWAAELATALGTHFEDAAAGGFFFTADDHEALLVRSKTAVDRAIPSGNAMAVRALDRLADGSEHPRDRDRFRNAATRTLHAFGGAMNRHPRAMLTLVWALSQRSGFAVDLGGVREGSVAIWVDVELLKTPRKPGEFFKLPITIAIDEGAYIRAHERGDWTGFGAEIEGDMGGGGTFDLADDAWPTGTPYKVGDQAFEVLSGTFTLQAVLTMGATPAPEYLLGVRVHVQACDARLCHPPHTLEIRGVIPGHKG